MPIYRVVETLTTEYYVTADSESEARMTFADSKHNEIIDGEDPIIEEVEKNPWLPA